LLPELGVAELELASQVLAELELAELELAELELAELELAEQGLVELAVLAELAALVVLLRAIPVPPVLDTGHPVPDTGHLVQGTVPPVPGTVPTGSEVRATGCLPIALVGQASHSLTGRRQVRQWESCRVRTGRELGAGWRRGSQRTRRRRDRSCCSGVGKLGREI